MNVLSFRLDSWLYIFMSSNIWILKPKKSFKLNGNLVYCYLHCIFDLQGKLSFEMKWSLHDFYFLINTVNINISCNEKIRWRWRPRLFFFVFFLLTLMSRGNWIIHFLKPWWIFVSWILRTMKEIVFFARLENGHCWQSTSG